jgi:hypothetical protein
MKVTLAEVGTVGVPEITPVEDVRVNPVGSGVLGLTVQLYGSVPPVAASCTAAELAVRYAVLITAVGSEVVVMVNVAGAMVSESVTLACTLLASVTVKVGP